MTVAYAMREPDGEQTAAVEEPEPVQESDEIPARIQAALHFNKSCLNQVKPVPVIYAEGFQCEKLHVIVPELHPLQEGAWRLACIALGDYFIGAVPQFEEEDG